MGGRLRDALFLVERRRRRRVAKLLRQMDRLDAGQSASPWRSYPAAQSPAGAHQHRRAMTAVLVVILGLGGVMAWSMYDTSPDRSPVFASRPDDSQDSRLEPSVAAKSDSKDYAFLQTQDGSDEPVTYDPCAPIHLVVNPRTIVEGGMRLLDEALDDVRAATGLTRRRMKSWQGTSPGEVAAPRSSATGAAGSSPDQSCWTGRSWRSC